MTNTFPYILPEVVEMVFIYSIPFLSIGTIVLAIIKAGNERK